MGLIFVNERTCINMEYQHMVRAPLIINTLNKFVSERDCRHTEIHRDSQKLIYFAFVMIDPLYSTSLVRNPNNENPAISIGERTDMVRKIARSNINALAVKSLRFFHCKDFFYTHIFPLGVKIDF